MQKATTANGLILLNKTTEYISMLTLILILSPVILFSSNSNTMVFGQDEQQNSVSENISICKIVDGNHSSPGSKHYQASNICKYQDSIGTSQALSELCYIFSDNGTDSINALCNEGSSNQTSYTHSNNMSSKNINQNYTEGQLKITIFDGVTDFFTNLFNR